MSDIAKPWYMFGKGDHDNDESDIDELMQRIQARIDSLPDEDEDSYDETRDHTVCDLDNEENKQFELINEKLSVFPESSSLLWLAVKLAIDKGHPLMADEYFKKLIAIPIKKHGFNTIISEIEYLMCDPFNKAAQIRKFVRFLQNKYPKREEGIYYEGRLEEELGNCEKSIELFKTATEKCNRAPKSAEHLANIMLEVFGEYEEVIKYADLADMMSVSKKPTVNMSELDSDQKLAKYALLKKRYIDGEGITADEIDELKRSYEELKVYHDCLKNDSNLQTCINKLNSLKTELEK